MNYRKIRDLSLSALGTMLWVLYFEHGWLPFQILFPLLAMVISWIAFSFVGDSSRKQKQVGYFSIVFTLSVVPGYLLVLPANFAQNYLMDHKGAVLVDAINEYKNEEGEYPRDISDVTPRYLNSRPTVWKGLRSWPIEYTKERDTFSLYIYYGEGYEGWYDTDAKNWIIHLEWAGS